MYIYKNVHIYINIYKCTYMQSMHFSFLFHPVVTIFVILASKIVKRKIFPVVYIYKNSQQISIVNILIF